MPWGIAATAVVGAWSANKQSKAGKKGAKGQQDAARAATEEDRRQYDLTRADQMPWLQAGQQALDLQTRYLAGDTSGFENSADYKFAVDQGFKGLNRRGAAQGNRLSGGADADRIALGQGLASQYGNDYWNKLSGRAGQGQTTANSLGQFGANLANAAGENAMNAANARASSYANSANAWSNFGNQLGNMAGQYGQRYNNRTTFV